jgi:hypothetical protein
MAYQLASYTDAYGTTHDAAYLRVTKVEIHHKAAQAAVSFEVYASKTAAEDGSSQPLKSAVYVFADETTSSSTSTLYTSILQCQAYLALKNHPSLTTLLSGATVV